MIWKETEVLAEMCAASVSNLLSSNFSSCEWLDGREWFFFFFGLFNIMEVIQKETEILAVWSLWTNTRKCSVLLWHGKG
jgi:hypothetical protein